jgi:hypothetical protein
MQSPTNIYLNNKYTQWYWRLLNRSRTRPLPSGKIHKHHEPPKCWGGTETYPLTVREHYIVHWLLLKMTIGELRSKMYYAFHKLTYSKNEEIRNSRKYEIVVLNHLDTISGENSPYYKKPLSEERKKKIGDSLRGKPKSEEHNRKNSESHKGKQTWWLNKHHTEEAKRKQREAAKNRLPESKESRQKQIESISQNWQITYPNGETKIIKNLRKFCRDNDLSAGNMCFVAQGKYKYSKGFKCTKVSL